MKTGPIDETMNCDEYRQAITADPANAGGEAHLAGCVSCREFRDSARAFNARIATALAIDVPPLTMPELPEIDTHNVTMLRSRGARTAGVWALAASVVIALAIGIRLNLPSPVYDSLGDEVLAHLDHEPAALRVTDQPVSARRLERAVPAEVAVFEPGKALVTYAQSCIINGKRVPHLVIQGEHGPVTILLMPEEAVTEMTPLEGQSVHGVIVPVGKGSIAIIGDREEALAPLQENLVKSVTWTT